MTKRVLTGVPGLDEVLLGGLIARRSYLLVGEAGAGKTILSLQWLLHGASLGERCMFVTLVEAPDTMAENLRAFGWSLDPIEVVDLTHSSFEESDDYRVFAPSEVERAPLYRDLHEAVERLKPQRLVIDSLTQLRYLSPDEYQFRKQMMSLVTGLSRQGCTTIFTHEPYELSLDVSAALAVDGVIRLRRDQTPDRTTEVRSIQVEKFRGSDFRAGRHHFRFSSDGMRVFAHQPYTRDIQNQRLDQLSSGIPSLDKLLGGGLELGTTTIITGPTGVGKSTLAATLLARAVAQGGRGLYLSFEEAASSILMRNEGIGLSLQPYIDSASLTVEHAHPRQYLPDELFQRLEKKVEEGVDFIVIDGTRGYESSMAVYGQSVPDLQNLVAFLLGKGVTIILTNEVEVIAGELRATEVGVSHVADNMILLRYAEYAGEVIKVVGCLKKRLGRFEPELREFRIKSAPKGIEVGPKLQHLRGILTGTPSYEPELHTAANGHKKQVGLL